MSAKPMTNSLAETLPKEIARVSAKEEAFAAMLAALKGAKDGLRYWEPTTIRGSDECDRITWLVDAAIKQAEACQMAEALSPASDHNGPHLDAAYNGDVND